MITCVITFWREYETSLTMYVSTICFLIAIMFILKAIKSYLNGHLITESYNHGYYSPALEKWGYTGFTLSVIPLSRNSVRFFCVTVFSGTIVARILKLGIHMDNELWYCGIENRTPCSYSSLYLSIFLSFTA